jgi:hypothetical protein
MIASATVYTMLTKSWFIWTSFSYI